MSQTRIYEIPRNPINTEVIVAALLSEKSVKTSRKGQYTEMILCDATGTIKLNDWDNVSQNAELKDILPGEVIVVKSKVSVYKEAHNLSGLLFMKPVTDENPKDYLPHYPKEILDKYALEFKRLLSVLDSDHQQLAIRMYSDPAVEPKIKIYPAGTYHHHNKLGGLYIHQIEVALIAEKLCDLHRMSHRFTSRCILLSLIHDIMKVDEYDISTGIRRRNVNLDHTVTSATFIEYVNRSGGMIVNEEEMRLLQRCVLLHHEEYGNYQEPQTSVKPDELNILTSADSSNSTLNYKFIREGSPEDLILQ